MVRIAARPLERARLVGYVRICMHPRHCVRTYMSLFDPVRTHTFVPSLLSFVMRWLLGAARVTLGPWCGT